MHQTGAFTVVTQASTWGLVVLPKSALDQLNYLCPVALRNVLAGSHLLEAEFEDIEGHAEQLGSLKLT